MNRSVEIGYALSSEEHGPRALVENAVRAEEAGFTYALISDHYHPWLDVQGHSPFVWSVLGGIAASTERLRVGTGVTCPTIRTHPAIIAQAAATTADMMPGRFFLGVGSGENLNEHVIGAPWPPADIRLEMLEEAIDLIRDLWRGEMTSFRGEYYTVDNARIYSLPQELPPIYMAASGSRAAGVASLSADGLISTTPDRELVTTFRDGGNSGPRIGQLTVCWAADEGEARKTAYRYWPNAALQGSFKNELPNPQHFEEATSTVTEEQVAAQVVCGPNPEPFVAKIQEFADAGFDHVYIHQVGPDQVGFLRFCKEEILPLGQSETAEGMVMRSER